MVQQDRVRRRWTWPAGLAVIVLMSGCSSPATDTSRSAHEALAASAAARQVLDQLDRGRTTGPAARVTLEAAATDLSSALALTATVVPETAAERRDLATVEALVGRAATSLATARALLEDGRDPAAARDLIAATERDLRRVVARLGPPR